MGWDGKLVCLYDVAGWPMACLESTMCVRAMPAAFHRVWAVNTAASLPYNDRLSPPTIPDYITLTEAVCDPRGREGHGEVGEEAHDQVQERNLSLLPPQHQGPVRMYFFGVFCVHRIVYVCLCMYAYMLRI